jgi:tRNA (cmo5U34)-methyltransferase
VTTGWTEDDSAVYRAIADVAVPRRAEMIGTLLAAVPFDAGDAIRIVELGSGDGTIAAALLDRFSRASIVAMDGSPSMRDTAAARLAPYGARVRVRAFDLASLDWWDVMAGADLVVSSLCLHHLNDAKKQYLYKAAADRLSARGALLVADVVEPMHAAARRLYADEWDASADDQARALGRPELAQQFRDARWNHFRFPDAADQPSPLLHHVVWLRHAGLAAVECLWLYAGHAVFGGFKPSAASEPQPPADS